MKKILITSALPLEMQAIKANFKKSSWNDFEFEFLILWVGNLNTVFELTQYVSKNIDIDFVVNIWICGKIIWASNELFLAYRSKYLSNMREYIHPLYLDFLPVESLACSDKIITNEQELAEEKYVDMESIWVEIVCNKKKIPYAIFKLPFDEVSQESLKVNPQEIIEKLWQIHVEKIINSLEKFFLANTSKVDFWNLYIWREKFSLTFTEFEMLKKALNREIAFWRNTEDILKNLWTYSKNEVRKFLQIKNDF